MIFKKPIVNICVLQTFNVIDIEAQLIIIIKFIIFSSGCKTVLFIGFIGGRWIKIYVRNSWKIGRWFMLFEHVAHLWHKLLNWKINAQLRLFFTCSVSTSLFRSMIFTLIDHFERRKFLYLRFCCIYEPFFQFRIHYLLTIIFYLLLFLVVFRW